MFILSLLFLKQFLIEAHFSLQSMIFVNHHHLRKLLSIIDVWFWRIEYCLVVIIVVLWRLNFWLGFILARMPFFSMQIEFLDLSWLEIHLPQLKLVLHSIMLQFIVWNLMTLAVVLDFGRRTLSFGRLLLENCYIW